MLEPEVPNTPELLYLVHRDPAELDQMLSSLRGVDIADALAKLSPEAAARVVAVMPFDRAVQVFDEPELVNRNEIVRQLKVDEAGPLIDAMSSDQKADLFRELPEADRKRLLPLLDPEARRDLELLLKYPRKSAGGIMTTEFVSVPSGWTVDDALQHIRRVGGLKETVYVVFVVDPDDARLVHTISLRELLLGASGTSVMDVGDRRQPLTVPPELDREDVARIISRYDLLAIPVVDRNSRILGIVTVDDVIDALIEEETEDVHKFGGVQAFEQPYMDTSIVHMVRKRGVWLTVLFLGQTLTASAMGYFEAEIERAVVLAIFIPLIISSGGNSGSQATSLIVRAMALREVRLRDWWRVAARELPAGLILGVILGALGFFRIIVWHRMGWYDYSEYYLLLALVVLVALVGVVAFGSLVGSMLPFALRRVGFDPASASAPFVATLVDVTGIVIYFSVAYAILSGTIL